WTLRVLDARRGRSASAGLTATRIRRCGSPPTHRRWKASRAGSAREVVDQIARDAVARGEAREGRAREPARVLELLGVHLDLAARVGGDEADHQLAREGPVLAADIGDVLHVDADLFLHLARHAALERLAVVDEAGDERVAARRPDGLSREQHAVAVAHDDDDRRVQVRVVLVLALRAKLAPLARQALGTGAAAGAEAARRLPPEGLHRHAAEREQIVAPLPSPPAPAGPPPPPVPPHPLPP